MNLDFNVLLYMLFLIASVSRSQLYFESQYTPRCKMNNECGDDCNCGNVKGCSVLPMNETSRTTMLFYHNQIRFLQTNNTPKPAGLAELEYDQELEDISECWATRCSSEYSSCFYTAKFRDTSQSVVQIILDVGQTPTLILWMQMNKIWQIQAKSIQVETVSSLPEGKQLKIIHNFAQIVSDRLYSVGCAWSLMERLLTFACTYGPRGPRTGEAIYKIGEPCSKCPKHFKCNNTEPFPRLCKKLNEISMTSISPLSSKKPSYSTIPHYKNNDKKFDQVPSEWRFQHSLPMPAPSVAACGSGCNIDHFSELTSASTTPTQNVQTESQLVLKIIQEYIKQLPLMRPQLPSQVMTQSTEMFTDATSVSPQLPSSSEYHPGTNSEASVPHYKVDINVNISFPREILTLRDIFQVTEPFKPVSVSVTTTLDPDDSEGYEEITTLSTINQRSTHAHRHEVRVFRVNTTTDTVINEFPTESNIHDTLRIWRKNGVGASNSSRVKKPTSSKDGNGASLFLFLGVSVLFLILGAFLVVLLMYILRMEATL
ncbi:hypothetical protein WA026_005424 [Henosepilachna vigintioctopunctata]|uniref:SCP domain-containing protein n=1 Tax=Henosepilachna vigintioctopunctata TaxID=420089 RepID=A0AAW1U133_9CUCU